MVDVFCLLATFEADAWAQLCHRNHGRRGLCLPHQNLLQSPSLYVARGFGQGAICARAKPSSRQPAYPILHLNERGGVRSGQAPTLARNTRCSSARPGVSDVGILHAPTCRL